LRNKLPLAEISSHLSNCVLKEMAKSENVLSLGLGAHFLRALLVGRSQYWLSERIINLRLQFS
jgi:hypothetical protein